MIPHQRTRLSGPEQRLNITLLGPPTLMWADQPYPIARRQGRALLYRIAATPQLIPRDQLCFLLWPDSPEATARRNLTVLLTQLRRALPLPDTLLTVDDAVGLNRDCVQTDVTTAAEVIPQAVRDGQPDSLAQALRLYNGPFLDGFSLPGATEFEAWMDQERQSWERRYLDGLNALVDGYIANGAYGAAIDAAQQVLTIDELSEETHRRLIELYAATGDRVAAIRQFERCVVVLERELGVAPLPETCSVYEAVRDGHLTAGKNRLGVRSKVVRDVLHALAAPDHSLPVTTPATRDSVPSTLPVPSTALIGRVDEVAATCEMIQSSDMRLLTLCGPGGSGKTRLALEIAWSIRQRFADGVVFVPLAPLCDPHLLIDAVAQACGVQETRAGSLVDAVRTALRDKHLLLVLDNFEHLLPAATTVADLLAAAPNLHVLVTSRSVLHLSGEQTLTVPPLPLPDLAQYSSPAALAEQPAIALLLARVRAHTPAFQMNECNATELAAICIHLDGLPLAIELAAARLKILSPQALLKRLDHRLALLNRGPCDLPDRHRTLRATIDWSYQLLDSQAQRLFERLAVFAGGWTLAAAEEICGDTGAPQDVLDGMQALRDSSLIAQAHRGEDEPRFWMLETIREYALEQLRARGDERAVRHKHANYFCHFAELCAPNMYSAEIVQADQDYHNMRVALSWSLDAEEHVIAARIVSALFWYWDTRGLIEEGQSWNARVRCLPTTLPQPLHARLRAQAGYLAYRRGHSATAAGLAATVITDSHAANEDTDLALRVDGLAALEVNDISGARRRMLEALAFAQEHGLQRDVAGAQFNLGILFLIQGELADAESLFWASYTYWEQQQHPRYMAVALITLGFIAVLRNDSEQAAELLRDGLQQLLAVQDLTYLLYALLACCGLATLQQEPLHAVTLFGAATRHAEQVGLTFIHGLLKLAQAQVEQARAQLASPVFEHALQHGRSLSLDAAVALAQAVIASVEQGELLYSM